MNLNLSEPALPATRLRLVYAIPIGQLAVTAGMLSNASGRITAAWQNNARAFVVSPATEPVQGGPPGAGVFGIGGAIAGDASYFTAIDLKTDYALPSMSWNDLVRDNKTVALGFLGIGPSAQLDHAELIAAGDDVAAQPAAQVQAAADSAAISRATSAPAQLASLADSTSKRVVLVLALVLAIGGGVYLWRKYG